MIRSLLVAYHAQRARWRANAAFYNDWRAHEADVTRHEAQP